MIEDEEGEGPFGLVVYVALEVQGAQSTFASFVAHQ